MHIPDSFPENPKQLKLLVVTSRQKKKLITLPIDAVVNDLRMRVEKIFKIPAENQVLNL